MLHAARRPNMNSTIRKIFHLDADAFFASVEQACDPKLRGKAIAVGGGKRGVISSASYEARKFGIKSAMPTAKALRLCPHLILIHGGYTKYSTFSRKMFTILYDYTPEIEICSIDEGYADLTSQTKIPAEKITREVQRKIREQLGISVSVGLGTNKLIAQIASKSHKPGGCVIVPSGQEREYLKNLSIGWLPGVGPTLQKAFEPWGITHIHQLAETPPDLLKKIAGNFSSELHLLAQGIDSREVSTQHDDAKSYSEQETFEEDSGDQEFILATLKTMTDRLCRKAREDRKCARTVTVKIRYRDMSQMQRSLSLLEPTDLETDIYPVLPRLLREAWLKKEKIRLTGLKLDNLHNPSEFLELPLPLPGTTIPATHQRKHQLAETIDQIRDKFGNKSILRGHDLLRENKPPPLENEES